MAGEFTFRRLTRADFPMVAAWLATPPMARWWNHEWSPEAVARDFGPTADGEEPAEDFIALLDGRPVGIVQRCRFVDYPSYAAELATVLDVPAGTATIDYGIGEPSMVGHGLGPEMICAFVERTWGDLPETPCLLVPVVAVNVASWRALEKAGFRRVASGPMEPDNPVDEPLHHVLRIDRTATAHLA